MDKTLPIPSGELQQIAADYQTPFHIYDEAAIRANARRLIKAFSWCPSFREYFAVKATPNPFILQILRDEGFGADCSSLAELVLAEAVGLRGDEIILTSNATPAAEFQRARALGAIINLDDIGHLAFLEQHAGLPEVISFRYNPGSLRPGNLIIGQPLEAKFGVTREQLFEGYREAQARGIKRFGLHTMVASNELDPAVIIGTARLLFELAVELTRELGIRLEFVNIGGGIGIPYRPEQQSIDLEGLAAGIRQAYQETIVAHGLDPVRLCMECGRFITGPYGLLVARVVHQKQTYKNYVALDATMADLMRPGMYGAYHHVTVLGKETQPTDQVYDVTGSLCENNDKFAIDRSLPEVVVSDLVAIHDTGAHGHAMGFNYNGKLRAAELLRKPDGQVVEIRRRESLQDYFATLDFPGLHDLLD